MDASLSETSSARATHAREAAPPHILVVGDEEVVPQYLRENGISNRVFTSYTDILDHCSDAWNKLVDQPGTIMSIGLREWVNA